MSKRRRCGTLDFETDPFLFGRVPKPFAAVIYFTDCMQTFWGDDVVSQVVEYLRDLPRCTLYAHNGGKFDFHFLVPHANREKIKIINGRIAEMRIGEARLVDSFPLLPFAMEAYKKTEIDYAKFESEVREKHRLEITRYMEDDALFLFELIEGFHKIVGRKMTIGGAAFAQMRGLDIEIFKGNESHDEKFRPYYYGGRCQAFEVGHWKDSPFVYIDINSAYPWAMLKNHAHGNKYRRSNDPNKIKGPEFVTLWAIARGCFPFRADDGSLSFPDDEAPRLYKVTGWEYLAAIETRSVKVLSIESILIPQRTRNFRTYVEKFYGEKLAAKKRGDKISELAYKYLVNSGYGKFATDPRDFKTYVLADYGEHVGDGYQWANDYGEVSVWEKSEYDGTGFYDVATAASITGCVRAYLWRTLCDCRGLLYCDTDSIICRHYGRGVFLGEELGQWKIEGRGSELAIAGKKLYALRLDSVKPPKSPWKTASKGVRLTHDEIIRVARGESVTHRRDSPNFSVRFGARFIERKIVKTG